MTSLYRRKWLDSRAATPASSAGIAGPAADKSVLSTAAAESVPGPAAAAAAEAAALANRAGLGPVTAGGSASGANTVPIARQLTAREELANLMSRADPNNRTGLHRMHLPPRMWAYWLSAPEEVQVGR